MANLIIKPTSGGLLKLQEDGGTDAISIGTDGKSTITNAVITAWTPPAGTVLQVVQGLHASETSTTSTTFAATGIDVAITPSATSSKILIMATTSAFMSHAGYVAYYTIYRGSTNLGTAQGFANMYQTDGTSTVDLLGHINMAYLDSPSTTSATTYQIYARVNDATCTTNWSMNNSQSTIICQEIKG